MDRASANPYSERVFLSRVPQSSGQSREDKWGRGVVGLAGDVIAERGGFNRSHLAIGRDS
jgi:hypothetical protein